MKDVFVSDSIEALKILVTRAGTTIRVGVHYLSPNVTAKWLAPCRVHRGHAFKLSRGFFFYIISISLLTNFPAIQHSRRIF
jgi:hypothetical protein